MGIQERKERERELRKSSIIDCAMKVFLAKGIGNSSMEEIAECSELSKATLYLYFKNKEEIILQVMNSVLSAFLELMEARMSKVEGSLDKIMMIKDAYLDYYVESHGRFMLLNSQESMAGMDFSSQECYRDYITKISRLWSVICAPIKVAISEGIFRKDTSDVEIAITLWSTSTGLMNMMDNIMETTNCKDFKKMANKTDFQRQLENLDYKSMMTNLWINTLSSYRNK